MYICTIKPTYTITGMGRRVAQCLCSLLHHSRMRVVCMGCIVQQGGVYAAETMVIKARTSLQELVCNICGLIYAS